MEEILFSLPRSRINGKPIVSDGERLALGLVEVGCRPKGKRNQLNGKKELFCKYWSQNYRKKHGLDWHPETYRMMAHYDPRQKPVLWSFRKEIDAIVYYRAITNDMLEQLDDRDKNEIVRVVKGRQGRELEKILEDNDSKKLHQIIVRGYENQHLCTMRGKMAEILVQKDIYNSCPVGMDIYRNGTILCNSKKYGTHAELDVMMFFYGREKYVELLHNIERLGHVDIVSRFRD